MMNSFLFEGNANADTPSPGVYLAPWCSFVGLIRSWLVGVVLSERNPEERQWRLESVSRLRPFLVDAIERGMAKTEAAARDVITAA